MRLPYILDALGVPELEVGIPAMGREEQETIQAIADLNLDARLIAWCRMTDYDLQQCRYLNVDMVDLSIPVSDQQIRHKLGRSREWVLAEIKRQVPLAQAMGLEVCVGGEDASRADPDFLAQVVEMAQRAGARRFRFADTVGIMEPFSVYERIQYLCSIVDLEIEMHAHDDFGMATANTLAAVRAGASHVNTTVHGLGERAGNAPLEEVVISLKHLYHVNTGIDLQNFSALSKQVADASGRPVGWQKSLAGEGAFTHEAGIHVDGLLKDPRNYQGLDRSELGRQHSLVLGKHSGARSLMHAYKHLGMDLNRQQASRILDRLRKFTIRFKRSPQDSGLRRFYEEITCSPAGEPTVTNGDKNMLDTELELESAEDFLEYFEIRYDPAVVQVNRLHILQRFHDYLSAGSLPADEIQRVKLYRELLQSAYDDFVKSDALTEKVFNVFKLRKAPAFVPLSSVLIES